MRIINGFTKTPHVLQILTFILIIYMNFEFGFFLFPLLQIYLKILGTIFFYSSSVILTFLVIKTMWIDPTDPLVLFQRTEKDNKREVNDDLSDYFCFYCQCYVHENSKHCKKCDRCVKDFDHHCVWLNNCIGGSNYRIFMTLISVVSLSVAIFLIFHGIVVLEYAQQGDQAFEFNNESLPKEKLGLYMIFIWTSALLSLLILIFVLNLLIFHIWLIRHKLTTYDYIISRRGKTEKKKRHHIQIKNALPQTDSISEQTSEKQNMDTAPFPSPDSKDKKPNEEREARAEKKKSSLCAIIYLRIKSFFPRAKRLTQIIQDPSPKENIFHRDNRDNTNDSSPTFTTPEKKTFNMVREFLIENGQCQTDQRDVATNALFDRSSTRNEYIKKNPALREGGSSTEFIDEIPRNAKRNLSLDYISETATQPDSQGYKNVSIKTISNSFDQPQLPKINLKAAKKQTKKAKQQQLIVVTTDEKAFNEENK